MFVAGIGIDGVQVEQMAPVRINSSLPARAGNVFTVSSTVKLVTLPYAADRADTTDNLWQKLHDLLLPTSGLERV